MTWRARSVRVSCVVKCWYQFANVLNTVLHIRTLRVDVVGPSFGAYTFETLEHVVSL